MLQSLPEHHCTAGQRRKWRASRPVGRVLCTRGCGPAAIHLGLPLPTASCGLPASIGRAVLKRSRRKRKIAGRFPLGLAPGGVYQAARVTPGAGGLLHHRFTLTSPAGQGPDHGRRSVFCGTVPRVTPGRCYRPPCPAEPGPSSPRVARRGRPADSLVTARIFSRVPPAATNAQASTRSQAPKEDPGRVPQHHLLGGGGKQAVPGHTNTLANTTGISGQVKRRFPPA